MTWWISSTLQWPTRYSRELKIMVSCTHLSLSQRLSLRRSVLACQAFLSTLKELCNQLSIASHRRQNMDSTQSISNLVQVWVTILCFKLRSGCQNLSSDRSSLTSQNHSSQWKWPTLTFLSYSARRKKVSTSFTRWQNAKTWIFLVQRVSKLSSITRQGIGIWSTTSSTAYPCLPI